jgi:Xaa-Pro dipeptidase
MSIDYYKRTRFTLKENLIRKGLNPKGALILLKGSFFYPEYDADSYYCREKYEENIQYLFGIMFEDVDALIDLENYSCFFIVKDLDPNSFFYSKQLHKEEARNVYGVDDVLSEKDLIKYLEDVKPTKILIYKGIDTASNNYSMFYDNKKVLEPYKDIVDEDTLFPILNEVRCLKSLEEVEMFKEVCAISSRAHVKCMQQCVPGMYEYQISAIFEKSFGEENAEDHAYNPICGSNRNGAYLHYQENTDIMLNGQLMLSDMGCKKNGICSDITCTYPINGVFSTRQKSVYNIVLKAQRNAINQLAPGVKYGILQDEAFKIILDGLKNLGMLKGDVELLFNKEIHKVFMPHHLGHFIGYRTHDVGPQKKKINTKFDKSQLPFLNPKERLKKIKKNEDDKKYENIWNCVLQEGMALTVEPGIYFIDVLLEEKKKDDLFKSFFNFDLIDEYKLEIGGIRIEDDLVITKDGFFNCTNCPRTVEEIEKCMAGEDWQ